MQRLTDEEIKRRLVELCNLRMLYGKARERITLFEAENKHLKERIKELEERDNDKNTKIEALAFQLEQIQNRVLGYHPLTNFVRCRNLFPVASWSVSAYRHTRK